MVGGHIISFSELGRRGWAVNQVMGWSHHLFSELGRRVWAVNQMMGWWSHHLFSELGRRVWALKQFWSTLHFKAYSSQCKKSISKFILLNFFRNLTLAFLWQSFSHGCPWFVCALVCGTNWHTAMHPEFFQVSRGYFWWVSKWVSQESWGEACLLAAFTVAVFGRLYGFCSGIGTDFYRFS